MAEEPSDEFVTVLVALEAYQRANAVLQSERAKVEHNHGYWLSEEIEHVEGAAMHLEDALNRIIDRRIYAWISRPKAEWGSPPKGR